MDNVIPYLFEIARRTEPLHASFVGKRVFVAGQGFYGKWMAAYFEHLVANGVDVKVTSASRKTGFHIEDLVSYPTEAFISDYVINCAGQSSGGNPRELLFSHGVGAIQLFHNMKIGATGLQFSSAAVNGDTPYGRAKRIAEEGIAILDCDVKIVRAFATVGPYMGLQHSFAASTFIRRALAGEILEVDSRPIYRSFAHITDLMVQCLWVMVRGDKEPYDVGGEDALTIAEAARALSPHVQVVDRDFASNASQSRYVPDLRRLQLQFGHGNPVGWPMSSRQALRDTHSWYFLHDPQGIH